MSNSATPGTEACQVPLSIGFPRQEYWSRLPFPPPGDTPDPEIEPGLPHCRQIFLPSEPPRKKGRLSETIATDDSFQPFMFILIRLLIGSIQFASPWNWTCLLTCFDQENVANVMLCQFWGKSLRGPAASTLTFLGPRHLISTQAKLLNKERKRYRPSPTLTSPAHSSTEATDVWMHPFQILTQLQVNFPSQLYQVQSGDKPFLPTPTQIE